MCQVSGREGRTVRGMREGPWEEETRVELCRARKRDRAERWSRRKSYPPNDVMP